MIERVHLSFGLVLALLLIPIIGCGDDDDGGQAAAGSGGESGGSAGDSGSGSGESGRGSSGAGGSGALRSEGANCERDAQCTEGLQCIQAAVQNTLVSICARPCTQDSECDGEVCASPYTGRPQDSHCINLEAEQFGPCGAGETAVCDNSRPCLYFPDFTIGVCVDICSPEGEEAEDGGPPFVACQAPQTCIPDQISTGDPNDMIGLCGKQVARGEVCGIDEGAFCASADVCSPMDPSAPEGDLRCYEDCTQSQTCAAGTCTRVSARLSYCKP